MIEGVIVLTTMLVFLGLIVFFRKAYGTKLDLQQQTRANVLYYASHACTGSTGIQPTVQQNTTIGGSRPAENAAEKTNIAGKAAASRTWNTASASVDTFVLWGAIWDSNAATRDGGAGGAIVLEKHPLVKHVSASSTVTCNEKAYSSSWKAWLEFALDLARRGGGSDLFK